MEQPSDLADCSHFTDEEMVSSYLAQVAADHWLCDPGQSALSVCDLSVSSFERGDKNTGIKKLVMKSRNGGKKEKALPCGKMPTTPCK